MALGTPQALLDPVRSASRQQRYSSGISTLLGALGYPLALHVSYLSEHSKDQFTNALADRPKPVDVNGNAKLQKAPDGGLDVEGIAAKTINGIDVDCITSADLAHQVTKAGPGSGDCRAANANVTKFLLERSSLG